MAATLRNSLPHTATGPCNTLGLCLACIVHHPIFDTTLCIAATDCMYDCNTPQLTTTRWCSVCRTLQQGPQTQSGYAWPVLVHHTIFDTTLYIAAPDSIYDCNTPKHPTTHHNTPHHTITHHNTPQHTTAGPSN